MATGPKILLLDEPLSNLDAGLRVKMRAELKELQQKLGITMIFVTHDQEEALCLSDRIVVMDHGDVAQIGTRGRFTSIQKAAMWPPLWSKSNDFREGGRRTVVVRPEASSFAWRRTATPLWRRPSWVPTPSIWWRRWGSWRRALRESRTASWKPAPGWRDRPLLLQMNSLVAESIIPGEIPGIFYGKTSSKEGRVPISLTTKGEQAYGTLKQEQL